MADRRIATFTGRLVDVFDLQPEDICIEDIAHALSQLNRYGGHTAFPYSVAQHSIIMARELEYRGYSKEVCACALLHDADEAYLVDLPNPIKGEDAFAFYRVLGDAIYRVVAKALGVQPSIYPIIRDLDREMVYHEAKLLFAKRDPAWEAELDAMPTTFFPRISVLSAAFVERTFLALWTRLNA